MPLPPTLLHILTSTITLALTLTLASTANANVEKAIFLGPRPVTFPNVPPALDGLHLPTLSPLQPVLSTQLSVHFPSEPSPRGLDSWYLLAGLQDGQRYEVRICWPATQPTDFWLDTFPIPHVFDTPHLLVSLAHHSQQLQHLNLDDKHPAQAFAQATTQSMLLLRIQAAASFYSTNRTLMDYPPPVDVDIILDPFMLNILPRSLGPVAVYITAVAIGAWFLSAYIYRWLLLAAADPPQKPHTD